MEIINQMTHQKTGGMTGDEERKFAYNENDTVQALISVES
jgi:hypothetical protein